MISSTKVLVLLHNRADILRYQIDTFLYKNICLVTNHYTPGIFLSLYWVFGRKLKAIGYLNNWHQKSIDSRFFLSIVKPSFSLKGA
jgi:hypothetical protein